MFTLVIDTSTERSIAGLVSKEKILCSLELPLGNAPSHLLLHQFMELLEHEGYSMKDIGAVTIGIGPGSYTGIRVGVSIGRAIAYALQLPIAEISGLYGFIPPQEGSFITLIDAKMGGVYSIYGTYAKKSLQFESEPQVLSLVECQNLLTKDFDYILSPHSKHIQTKLNTNSQWIDIAPCSLQMARFGSDKIAKVNVEREMKPLIYLRKTQAEIEREQKT